MYGHTFKISHRNVSITMRAFCMEDIPHLVRGFSSISALLHTNMIFAQTYNNELKWFERTESSLDVVTWAIVPENSDIPIGVTGLHDIRSFDGSCTSGIIIWDKSWWGKGIASAAHLGRTLFAADTIKRTTIKSLVRSPNPASYKALQRIGYTIWGTEPVSDWREGRWMDTHNLKWFHPECTQEFFPNGVPEMYLEGINKAKISLDLAREIVIR